MIKIYKDRTKPDAIAAILKLNLGFMLEDMQDMPGEITFKAMRSSNKKFEDWIIHTIKVQALFANNLEVTDICEEDVLRFELRAGFIEEIFFILDEETRENMVHYKTNMMLEMSSSNPQYVEID